MDSEVADAGIDFARDKLKGCAIPLLLLLCALFGGAGWFAHAAFSAAN